MKANDKKMGASMSRVYYSFAEIRKNVLSHQDYFSYIFHNILFFNYYFLLFNY